MNVGIGTEATQFLFREYINLIFDTVYSIFSVVVSLCVLLVIYKNMLNILCTLYDTVVVYLIDKYAMVFSLHDHGTLTLWVLEYSH
jgi:hypothetical protein